MFSRMRRRGPPITTRIGGDEQTQRTICEKYSNNSNLNSSSTISKTVSHRSSGGAVTSSSSSYRRRQDELDEQLRQQHIISTNNKRCYDTEILGSSLESTKTSQRAPDGQRHVTTTHIVRKVTTLSRGDNLGQQHPEDLLPPTKMLRSSELEYRGGGSHSFRQKQRILHQHQLMSATMPRVSSSRRSTTRNVKVINWSKDMKNNIHN